MAAQRPFYFDHVAELTDLALAEFYELTGTDLERKFSSRTIFGAETRAARGARVVRNPARTPRGRVATPAAWYHLGLEPPAGDQLW